jgi:hypothetical protein
MGYLFTFISTSDPYYGHWLNMRRRFALTWICFFGQVPVILTTWMVLDYLSPNRGHSVFWENLPAALVFVAARIYAISWPCPRFGKPFFSSYFFLVTLTLTDNCLHCGLPKYAPKDNDVKCTKSLDYAHAAHHE